MKVLNLGCGEKTSDSDNVVNIDWSAYFLVKRAPLLYSLAKIFLSGPRLESLNALPDNIVLHNLKNGIPFPDQSVDVVYHSHLLEHLDHSLTEAFLKENLRVLRKGGILRVVVPDLEALCREYLAHLELCAMGPEKSSEHNKCVSMLIEQCVRKEASGTSQQNAFSRFVENIVLGDARKRGETHQWMYDRINLPYLLKDVGFNDVRLLDCNSSMIDGWANYGLDLDEEGKQYKPLSLYVEAVR